MKRLSSSSIALVIIRPTSLDDAICIQYNRNRSWWFAVLYKLPQSL